MRGATGGHAVRDDASVRLSPEERRARLRTLRIALALSAWAPLATGVAVATSRSTTQLADFVRRTVELAAIAAAYLAFARGGRPGVAPLDRTRLERGARWAVVAALAGSAAVLAGLAAARGGHGFRPSGDVAIGLAVALLGLLTNGWFWRRYARFEREGPSSVIAGQRALYAAKSVVDGSVALALATVAVAPGTPVARWADLLGSCLVAAYLAWSAAKEARAMRREP